ncbi:hypothetical protein NP493_262g01044 [Ridgeia piscesae]|uniref:Uncharacterized protein n=1 Tax=Ridgeia piscesae TaxID=27915 RepID=A0AAD9NXY0_RIDPI|nr:hypothetical protein NP493_262g01044 [Ridgeia piscesae]
MKLQQTTLNSLLWHARCGKPNSPIDYEVGNSFYRDSAQFMTLEDAVAARALEKTAKQYTHFDWSRVPRADERRLTKKPYEQPHFITTIFR